MSVQHYDIYPQVLHVIDLISQGETTTAACFKERMSVSTFKKYVAKQPELQELLTDAEQIGYDVLAEALVNIDNDARHGRSDPKMAKVISDNIKWLLEKRKPKEYGQKVQVDVNVTADRAVTDALSRAKQRAQGMLPDYTGKVIDVTPVVSVDEDEAFLKSIGC